MRGRRARFKITRGRMFLHHLCLCKFKIKPVGMRVKKKQRQSCSCYSGKNTKIDHLPYVQSSTLNMMKPTNSGKSKYDSLVQESSSDLDVPTALWKGVRSYSHQPTSNFVSYHQLNSSFKTFTTNISCVCTPKTIQEPLENQGGEIQS